MSDDGSPEGACRVCRYPSRMRMWRRVLIALLVVCVTVPISPARGLEFPTPDGLYSGGGPIGAGQTLDVTIAGRLSVPASGVDSVLLNVTVTNPTAESYLTIYPTGRTRPNSSNLNFVSGQTVPNMVVAKLGAGGQISIFNSGGSTDVIVDVLGWFPVGGSFTSLEPARLMDTRIGYGTLDGQFGGIGSIGAHGVVSVPMLGRGGIPTSGVDSVVLNVTATRPTAGSYITVWPAGTQQPTTSNLNFTAGTTTPNLVIAKLGSGGLVSFANDAGGVDVIVDVLGWFPVGGALRTVGPARIADTRPGNPTIDGLNAGGGPLGPRGYLNIDVSGRLGIPPGYFASGPGAVVLNITATNPTATSYFTVFDGADSAQPPSSNLNFTAGQTVSNMVVSRALSGKIRVYNDAGSVDVIVDIVGWFPFVSSFNTVNGERFVDTRRVPPAPARTLQPRSYSVNSDLQPGRYVADAAKQGCDWSRTDSFGYKVTYGPAAFAGREVVDIRPSDQAFTFSGLCGTFKTYSQPASQSSTIVPGTSVVGGHIKLGTYTSFVRSGCFWKTLRGFTGDVSDHWANDFFGASQQYSLTLTAADVGFYSNPECGTWTLVGG